MRKEMIRKGYNKIAKSYLKSRNQFKSNKYLRKLSRLLKPNSAILDIGCGSGKPIDKFFINKGHKIMGIDISEEQIKLAKKNFPKAEYKVKDISKAKLGEYKVDAIVSFYTIFHILRNVHHSLFKKFNSFLPEGGLILVTMGSKKWGGTENDFHGVKMWWSHYGIKENRKIIKEAGFKIIFEEIDTNGGERHWIVLAKKHGAKQV